MYHKAKFRSSSTTARPKIVRGCFCLNIRAFATKKIWMDIHDGNVLLYIHNVNYDKEVIKIGIDIIDHFKMNLDKLNANVDVNTIKKRS